MIKQQELEWKSIRIRNANAPGQEMEKHQDTWNDNAPGLVKHQDMKFYVMHQDLEWKSIPPPIFGSILKTFK